MKKSYYYTLQLESPDASPSMRISALRTLSYTLKTLGEVRHDRLVIIFGFLVPLYIIVIIKLVMHMLLMLFQLEKIELRVLCSFCLEHHA
jgi:hypothetical protein